MFYLLPPKVTSVLENTHHTEAFFVNMEYNNNIDNKFIVLIQQNIIVETACLRMAFEFFNLDLISSFFLEKCCNTFNFHFPGKKNSVEFPLRCSMKC